jgi:Leucine-rich repeat (LRR) protein
MASSKPAETTLIFPPVSVGKIQFSTVNKDMVTDRIFGIAEAKGKVLVPAGAAIVLTLNYEGSQRDDVLNSIPKPILRRLNMSDLEVSDKLVSSVSNFKSLVSLDLEGVDLTDNAAKPLASLTGLQNLNVGNTLLTSKGLSFLAGMTNLKMLKLSRNCKLGDDIGPILGKFKSLQILDICGTNVHNKTLEYLASMTSLKQLNVRRNSITDLGIEHILKLKNLTHLDVTDTLITSRGLMRLQALPKLKSLTFRQIGLSSSEINALHKALPKVNLESGSREKDVPASLFAPLH